jgi:hypothetical protein
MEGGLSSVQAGWVALFADSCLRRGERVGWCRRCVRLICAGRDRMTGVRA